MTFIINPLLKTDAYKIGHPKALEALKGNAPDYLYSNYTNRGSRMEGINRAVHFGLQAYLVDLQDDFEEFFKSDKQKMIAEYKRVVSPFAGDISVKHIEDLHDLGYLPIRFSSLKEGTLVPMRIPSITIENTVAGFGWLVNYLETNLSASIWHAQTVATKAYYMRKNLENAASNTGGPVEAVDFQWHDFSYRGQHSWETAAASGAAHLLSFKGSDSVPAALWAEHYYPGKSDLIAASVPATEHSIMMLGTELYGEQQTFQKLLETYPTGILSVVSDTYNLWDVLTKFLPELKELILSRDGKLVIRPDSGKPADIICGTASGPMMWDDMIPDVRKSNEGKGVINLLWEVFGGTINAKGYKELDPHIGLIYGDSITPEVVNDVFQRLEAMGFASTNVVFGAGSYFAVGNVTRDSLGSAVKQTWAKIGNEEFNLSKDPITDSGLKKSATGRLAVFKDESGELYLKQKATVLDELSSELQPVWKDGKFVSKMLSFEEVRENLKSQI